MNTSHSHFFDRIQTLEGFLQQDPDNLPLQRELIGLHLAAGQPRRAAKQAESALSLNPSDTAMQATLASCLLAADDRHAALDRSAGWLLAGDPSLVQIRQLQLVFSNNDAETALGDLMIRLFDAGSWADLQSKLTVLRGLHFLRRTAEARSRAEALLLEDGCEAVAGLTALLAFDEGDAQRALELVDAYWRERGNNIDMIYLHASFALASGEMPEAEVGARRALELSPDDGRCWSVWGQIQLRNSQFKQAQSAFERALQLMPGHVGSHHLLGWALLLQGDRIAARSCFDQALALDRNFGESHGAIAVVDVLDGRRDGAKAAVERAFRLDRRSLGAKLANLLLAQAPGSEFGQLNRQVLREWELMQRLPEFASLVASRRTLH